MLSSHEIKAELSVKTIEFDKAKDLGLPHSHLIGIYRKIKELQYQLIIASLHESESKPNQSMASDFVIE